MMTPEQMFQNGAAMQAASIREPIERSPLWANDWRECDSRLQNWRFKDFKYRPAAKPQPKKLRPFTFDEFPKCRVLLQSKTRTAEYEIMSRHIDGVYFGGLLITWAELLEHWQMSTDDGKTWKPCGVEE